MHSFLFSLLIDHELLMLYFICHMQVKVPIVYVHVYNFHRGEHVEEFIPHRFMQDIGSFAWSFFICSVWTPVINLCSHVFTHMQNGKLVGSFLPKICMSFFGNHSDTPYSQRWVRSSHASLSETQLISPKRDCVCNPTCMRLCKAFPFVYNGVSREMET